MPIALHARPPLAHLVAQHAEEAAFLWSQRDRATEAPHFGRRHLAHLEQRVAAHLSGLVVAGAVGVQRATAQWQRYPGSGEAFAVLAAALQAGDHTISETFVRSAAPIPAVRRGLSGALGWCQPSVSAPLVRRWATSAAAMERWLVLCACSHHRANAGGLLVPALSDADDLVRARALRLAGEIGRQDLRGSLLTALDDPAPEPAFWAAWSCHLLGETAAARPRLQTIALSRSPRRRMALEAVLRGDTLDAAAAWVRTLHRDPAQVRLTVRALGHVGDPASVPWLIACMTDPALARLAGDSVSLITGVDLVAEKLDAPPPPNRPEVPNDDPADARVALDPDDGSPWPDPARVAAWWQDRQDRFRPGVRHMAGWPIDTATAERVWQDGTQPQRRAAAYELARLERRGLRNWRGREARTTALTLPQGT
jgi:uncharacterized protein (TIGR02270 family)